MTIESEIYDRLTGHAGVAALVGDCVYFGKRPQNSPLPAIAYRRVSRRGFPAMAVDAGVVKARYQFDCYAASGTGSAGSRQLADQVRLALNRWSTSTGTIVQDTYFVADVDLPYNDEADLYQATLDFEINYEE